MAYEINRTLDWIGLALKRARGKLSDSANPNIVPDVILPTIDVLGWDKYLNVKAASNTALVGVESVFPATSQDWPSGIGTGGVVPEGVIRLIYHLGVFHTDELAPSHFLWLCKFDQEANVPLCLPTDSGGGVLIENNIRQTCTRMFLMKPREDFVGRVRGLNAARFLSIEYSWIDFEIGEYIPSLV